MLQSELPEEPPDLVVVARITLQAAGNEEVRVGALRHDARHDL